MKDKELHTSLKVFDICFVEPLQSSIYTILIIEETYELLFPCEEEEL